MYRNYIISPLDYYKNFILKSLHISSREGNGEELDDLNMEQLCNLEDEMILALRLVRDRKVSASKPSVIFPYVCVCVFKLLNHHSFGSLELHQAILILLLLTNVYVYVCPMCPFVLTSLLENISWSM